MSLLKSSWGQSKMQELCFLDYIIAQRHSKVVNNIMIWFQIFYVYLHVLCFMFIFYVLFIFYLLFIFICRYYLFDKLTVIWSYSCIFCSIYYIYQFLYEIQGFECDAIRKSGAPIRSEKIILFLVFIWFILYAVFFLFF